VSLIHYLFAGHFEREDGHVKFARGPDGAFRPVVRRPLDAAGIIGLPAEWSAWVEGGYLICDKYTRNEGEVEFVTRLVEATGCDLYDAAAHRDISVAEWRALTPVGTRD
jgi:hypothetical protein